MFEQIARLILRNRNFLTGFLLLLTVFMGFMAQRATTSYKILKLLPDSDSTQQVFARFEETFGGGDNAFILSLPTKDAFSTEELNQQLELTRQLEAIEGITWVISMPQVINLQRNDSLRKFEVVPLFQGDAFTDSSAAAFKAAYNRLPFYQDLLVAPGGHSVVLFATMKPEWLNTKEVVQVVEDVKGVISGFEAAHNTRIHVSGLPYIRMANNLRTKKEVGLFVGLSLLFTSVVLLFFLRSWRAMAISLAVVLSSVIWSLGFFGLFGFEITLMGILIPTLVIVIGVPNCIFLINKYHAEYKKHRNKVMALQRVISRVGPVSFVTNLTTALGFAGFIITEGETTSEFGIMATLSILTVFLLSLVFIPSFYSFVTAPKDRHFSHFDKRWVQGLVDTLGHWVQYKRRWVYVVTMGVLVVSLVGMTRMTVTGNIASEMKADDPVIQDLQYLEREFGGVVPLEIEIDTRKPGGLNNLAALKKMDRLQQELNALSEGSRTLSLVNLVKFGKQAYYNGDPAFYELPTNQEKNFILRYVPRGGDEGRYLKSFIDSTRQKARISMNIMDMGKEEMVAFKDSVQERVNRVYGADDNTRVTITGSAMVFLKNTDYLMENLLSSIALAVVVIGLIMIYLFRSGRMVFISLLPNFLPLIVTAGLMGFLDIPLKTSTISVFSIAFGIAVDDTLHYLARYRLDLKLTRWNIKTSVLRALRETGVSMFYTSIVLFFGFSVFGFSGFSGIQALGLLLAVTLLVAMVSNLVLLPALLLSFEHKLTQRNFSPAVIALDEERPDEEE
jgi:predicted RND superfamily exporter protein